MKGKYFLPVCSVFRCVYCAYFRWVRNKVLCQMNNPQAQEFTELLEDI